MFYLFSDIKYDKTTYLKIPTKPETQTRCWKLDLSTLTWFQRTQAIIASISALMENCLIKIYSSDYYQSEIYEDHTYCIICFPRSWKGPFRVGINYQRMFDSRAWSKPSKPIVSFRSALPVAVLGKIFGGPGPSSFGRQQRLSEITTQLKIWGGCWARFGGTVSPGPIA